MYSFFQYYKTLGSIASYVVETYLIFFNFKNWDGYVIGQRICWCAGIKMLPQISRTCNTHYMQVLNFRVKNVSVTIAAFTLPQKLARLNRGGLGPDLAHFSGTVYIATKTSSVDPSPVRGARLYVLPFYSFLVE